MTSSNTGLLAAELRTKFPPERGVGHGRDQRWERPSSRVGTDGYRSVVLKHLKEFGWIARGTREKLEAGVAQCERQLAETDNAILQKVYREDLAEAQHNLEAFDPSQIRWWIYGEKGQFGKQELTIEEYEALVAEAQTSPYELAEREGSKWWFFRDRFYKADADLSPEDVIALALEAENRKRLKLDKAHALQAMRQTLDSKARRQSIPQDVKLLVWQRDGGRCAECGSQDNLEYDHIIPLALGGSNTDRNLQLLCESCNRRKGPTLG